MPEQRLRVLVLSELFPNPVRPAFGVFVERQVFHLQSTCDNVVVVPTRVFPHLRLWKHPLRPLRFLNEWRQWRAELKATPTCGEVNGMRVVYPRYTSPPKQVFHALWGFFAYVFLRRRLRALHREQPFDLIHAHYASPCGVIALLAQRWMKVPVVLSVHGSDVTYTAKQNPLDAAIIRWTFRGADVILANSTWTAQQIERYGVKPDKVRLVRLGGNAPASVSTAKLGVRNGATTLLSVANLYQSKGHAYTLRAMRQLIDAGYLLEYIIVGDGPERSNLGKLAEDLKLSGQVRFEGYKAHEDVWPYLAACDILVLPSWVEGFGIAYLEALALGKPAIGCEGTGGPADLKALGDCIELVKPRDVKSLAGALKRLIDDPERCYRMGQVGRRIVAEYFTWEQNAIDTIRIYRQVLDLYR